MDGYLLLEEVSFRKALRFISQYGSKQVSNQNGSKVTALSYLSFGQFRYCAVPLIEYLQEENRVLRDQQGELTTREYDRTVQVPNGKKTIEHVIEQLAVELKADTIRLLRARRQLRCE